MITNWVMANDRIEELEAALRKLVDATRAKRVSLWYEDDLRAAADLAAAIAEAERLLK